MTRLRTVFVGGPGRSGTSFVADRLGRHPLVASYPDIELKIFCERGGLVDLHDVLTRSYSPNRAVTAMVQFQRMTDALIAGHYGQRAYGEAAPAERLAAHFAAFRDALSPSGHPGPTGEDRFFDLARSLLAQLAAEAPAGAGARLFLEKTPHNLLFVDFLARIAPGAAFIHVMRDPRAIAYSLLAMRWGPDELEAATAWVAGYCRAWSAAEARAAERGLTILRLHVEDVAADPEEHARRVLGHLGLAPDRPIFAGADLPTLQRGLARADAGERELLDSRLGGWAHRFGYDPQRPGHRPGAASADAAPVEAAVTEA